EVFRTLQILRQQVNGNGGGVGGDDRIFTNHVFHFTQNNVFNFRVLNNGFNNQVNGFEVTVAQRRNNTVQNVCHFVGLHTAFFDAASQQFFGFVQTGVDTRLSDILHQDRGAVQCGLVSHTATHDTRTQYSGLLHRAGLGLQILGFFLQLLIIQEQADQAGSNAGLRHFGKALGFNFQSLVTRHARMLLHGFDGFNRRWVIGASLSSNEALRSFEGHHAFHLVQLQLAGFLFTTGFVIDLASNALLQQVKSSGLQLLGSDNCVNSAVFQSVFGAFLATGTNPLNGVIRTDQTGQTNGSTETWEDT